LLELLLSKFFSVHEYIVVWYGLAFRHTKQNTFQLSNLSAQRPLPRRLFCWLTPTAHRPRLPERRKGLTPTNAHTHRVLHFR